MLMLDKTSERLRSKHVRTLELLQKTLDENVELRDRISQLQKGTLHLSQGEPPSNRTNELEDEIDRLKAEHCSKLVATEEAARLRRDELQRSIAALQTKQLKLQNDALSLETKLASAREALQNERVEWHRERKRLEHENQALRNEIQQAVTSQDATSDATAQRHAAELLKLQLDLDEQRQLVVASNVRDERLREEIAGLCGELNQHKETIVTQRTQLEAAHQQIQELQQREEALNTELELSHAQVRSVEAAMYNLRAECESALAIHAESHAYKTLVEQQQQQYAAALSQLSDLEEHNRRLVGENRTLHESLGKLQTHHAELTRANSASGSVFATHIDLKRENFHLRAQIDELKALQRRFLTTANKKTMKFPAIGP